MTGLDTPTNSPLNQQHQVITSKAPGTTARDLAIAQIVAAISRSSVRSRILTDAASQVSLQDAERATHGSFLIRRQRGHPGVVLPLVHSSSANHEEGMQLEASPIRNQPN